MAIKITKKKASSNKGEIPGKNGGKDSDPHNTPAPFIDKITVLVGPLEGEVAHQIYNAIWTAADDKDVFRPAKKGGDYNFTKRIPLGTVTDAKMWPLFQADHDKAEKLTRGLRIEFVPVDLGPDGLAELNSTLVCLVPDGWRFFVKHGRISRIDITVNLPFVQMDEFHFLPKQAATTTMWRSDGKLQTYQQGKSNSNHTQLYDRGAKRTAKGQSSKGKTGTRLERRLKKGVGTLLLDLPDLPNPFSGMAMVGRNIDPPPKEKKAYVWNLFLQAADQMGLSGALALLPEDKRGLYKAHLQSHAFGWWDVDAIWAKWPKMLEALKIADLKSW